MCVSEKLCVCVCVNVLTVVCMSKESVYACVYVCVKEKVCVCYVCEREKVVVCTRECVSEKENRETKIGIMDVKNCKKEQKAKNLKS